MKYKKYIKNILIFLFILTTFIFASLWYEEKNQIPKDSIQGSYTTQVETDGSADIITFDEEASLFIYYRNGVEIDRGSFSKVDHYIYEIQGELQNTYIILNEDNSFYYPLSNDQGVYTSFIKMDYISRAIRYFE